MKGGYRDLIVWQKSIKLVLDVYQCTDTFPDREIYGLTAQIRRCAVSIPSNVAEGSRRTTRKDFKHFLTMASGSAAELETQLEIARSLGYAKPDNISIMLATLSEVSRMLYAMVHTEN